MVRSSKVVIAALALAVGGRALAGDPGSSPYPVPVRLVVAPGALAEKHFHQGEGGPLIGRPVVDVGQLAREAYAAAVARMFAPAGQAPAAALQPRLVATGFDQDGAGWFAWMEQELVLRDAAGAEVARWVVRGEGRMVGLAESGVERAFREAAEAAARTFEVTFEERPGAIGWLAAWGVPPGTRAAVLPALAARWEPVWLAPPRPNPDRAPFAEVGGGLLGGPGWASAGLAVRAGRSGPRWLVQGTVDAWPREMVARPAGAWGESNARAWTLGAGVDAGLQLRPPGRIEVAAGLGAALRYARASASWVLFDDPTVQVRRSQAVLGVAGSAFAQVRFHGVLPGQFVGYRAGAEVRQAVGTRQRFDRLGASAGLTGLSAALFVGLEWGR